MWVIAEDTLWHSHAEFLMHKFLFCVMFCSGAPVEPLLNMSLRLCHDFPITTIYDPLDTERFILHDYISKYCQTNFNAQTCLCNQRVCSRKLRQTPKDNWHYSDEIKLKSWKFSPKNWIFCQSKTRRLSFSNTLMIIFLILWLLGSDVQPVPVVTAPCDEPTKGHLPATNHSFTGSYTWAIYVGCRNHDQEQNRYLIIFLKDDLFIFIYLGWL